MTALDEEVEAILKEEREEKLLSQTDMAIRKGENIMAHEDEIHARPRRTWFESEREKLQAKKAGREELNGRIGIGKVKSVGKLSNKDKKALDDKRDRIEGRAWKKGKVNVNAPGTTNGKHQGRERKGKGSRAGIVGKREGARQGGQKSRR